MSRLQSAVCALTIAGGLLTACAPDPNVRDVTLASGPDGLSQYRVYPRACLTSNKYSVVGTEVSWAFLDQGGALTGSGGQTVTAQNNPCATAGDVQDLIVGTDSPQDPDYDDSLRKQPRTIVRVGNIPCEPGHEPHCVSPPSTWTEFFLLPVAWTPKGASVGPSASPAPSPSPCLSRALPGSKDLEIRDVHFLVDDTLRRVTVTACLVSDNIRALKSVSANFSIEADASSGLPAITPGPGQTLDNVRPLINAGPNDPKMLVFLATQTDPIAAGYIGHIKRTTNVTLSYTDCDSLSLPQRCTEHVKEPYDDGRPVPVTIDCLKGNGCWSR